ncbi:MAG TPA: GNAT family N-acetyltransferase [Chloroflexota bacterium]|nr:GNAT family N-acetyltransferase [Chloroflexota bacterium]
MPRTPIHIAPLSKADIPACVHIMSQSLPWTRYQITEESARKLWSAALATEAAVVVARLEGQTMGFAWYIEHGGFGLGGYLKLLGVHAAARGRGVGGALLDHVEWLADQHGQRDLFLLVSDFNAPAQAFYRARGYTQVGEIPDLVVSGIAELIFRKRLKGFRDPPTAVGW